MQKRTLLTLLSYALFFMGFLFLFGSIRSLENPPQALMMGVLGVFGLFWGYRFGRLKARL